MQQITVRSKLGVTPEGKRHLLATMELYTDSYNRTVQVAWPFKRINAIEIHKLTYDFERKRSPLPSQLVISARNKACESVAAIRTWEKKERAARKAHIAKNKKRMKKGEPPKFRKDRTFSCPHSEQQSIRYDARSARIDFKAGTVFLACLEKNKTVRGTFEVPKYAKHLTEYESGSADLVQYKNGDLWLHITVKVPDMQIVQTGIVVGADAGVEWPLTTSDGLFLGILLWKEIVRRIQQLRARLQAKGTRSAKRHLRRLEDREYRFRKDCDHVLSKKLLQALIPGSVLVLEDLTDIRERLEGNREFRRMIHGWSFARLQTFICYKAALVGIKVVFVPAYYTSQRCSLCGHTEKGNRTSQAHFQCKKCNFTINADINAARNLRELYLRDNPIPVSLTFTEGRPVNAPIVSRQLRVSKTRSVVPSTVQLDLFESPKPAPSDASLAL